MPCCFIFCLTFPLKTILESLTFLKITVVFYILPYIFMLQFFYRLQIVKLLLCSFSLLRKIYILQCLNVNKQFHTIYFHSLSYAIGSLWPCFHIAILNGNQRNLSTFWNFLSLDGLLASIGDERIRIRWKYC